MVGNLHKRIIRDTAKAAGVSPDRIADAIDALDGKTSATHQPDTLLITQAEAGRLLQCSRWTVRRLTAQGSLKPVRVLGLLRYRREDVLKLAQGSD